LVLKDPDALKEALAAVGEQSTIRDLQHAPKLLALRYVSEIFLYIMS
jgi:hypothetical protein